MTTVSDDAAGGKASMPGSDGWIQTASGKKFYPLDPRPEDIDIEDIAVALSRVCRFSGHTRKSAWGYSVAQHSVLVSEQCPNYPLHGLLHDAAEAYLGDVARPLKKTPAFEAYRDAEDELFKVIAHHFGLVTPFPVEVYHADNLLLAAEARDLMGPLVPGWKLADASAYKDHITPWWPAVAREAFLERFKELTR